MEFVSRHWGNYEFYQLVNGYPGGVIIFAPNGDIFEVNQAFATTLGCPEDRIYEHNYTGISDGESQSTEAELLKTQAVHRGHTDVYEKKYRIENGQPVIVKQHTCLIRNDVGQPQFFLAMLVPGPLNATGEGGAVVPVNSVSDDLTDELVFLRNQNARLQTLLQKAQENTGGAQLQKELASLDARNDSLKDELSALKESEMQLSRKVKALTTTLEWKDKCIAELEEIKRRLEKEIREVRGELDVIKILESAEKNPLDEEKDELPLPWEVAKMQADDADSADDKSANNPTDVPVGTPVADEKTSPEPSSPVADNTVLNSNSADRDKVS